MNKRTPDSAKVRIAKTLTAGNLQRAIDGYLQDSRMRMQSPRTIEQKQEHTGKLVWYIQRERLAVVDEACISSFLSYILTAHTNPLGRWETAGAGPVCNVTAAKRPVRRNTIRSYFTTLRAFFRWCIERRILDESPMALLKPPVKQQRPPVPLTVDHISRLIEAAARSRQSARDVAVVWLLFDAGLRRFELTALKIADVDQYSNRLTVRHGKGDKERVVYMGRKCGDALWTYLSTRGGAASDEALFEAKDGGHLQNGGLSQLIRRLGEAAGITDVHVSTHKLRHSYAVEKLAAGCTDLTLMRSMGHSTLDSTKAYSHFSADMMQRMHHQFSPGDQINAGTHKKGRPRLPVEGNLIEAYGERKRLVQWLSDPRCIVGKSCLIARLKSGVDAETAMSSPSQRGTVLKPVAVEAVKAEKTAVDPLDSILDTLDTETLKKLLAMKLARDG